MNDYPVEDNLIEEIQRKARAVRLICGNTDTYGSEAWSKRQLIDMISDIEALNNKILELTGIVDLEADYVKSLEGINPRRPGDAHKFVPYSDSE